MSEMVAIGVDQPGIRCYEPLLGREVVLRLVVVRRLLHSARPTTLRGQEEQTGGPADAGRGGVSSSCPGTARDAHPPVPRTGRLSPAGRR